MTGPEVLLPIDPVLGDARTRFAPQRVLEACREQLSRARPDKRESWRHCEMVEALYHPGRYIRIAYVLLADSDVPEERRWPEGDIVYLHTPVREPMSRRGEIIDIDGWKVEAYAFPNDRRLRGLRKFAGTADAVDTWSRWLSDGGVDFQIDPRSLQRLLARYVPEQKWIVRLRAEGVAGGNGARTKRRIAVRSASEEACTRLQHRHRAMAAVASESGDLFRVPDIVGSDLSQGLLAVEWIRGDSLLETLQRGPAEAVLERVARVLNSVHRARIPSLNAITPRHLAERVCEAIDDLAAACPAEHSRAEAVGLEVAARLSECGAYPEAMLHNDFHWNQFRIKRDRFALFDLERMALGDPLIDVANFATQLRMLGQRSENSVDSETAQSWSAGFLDIWSRMDPGAVHPRRLHTYAVVSLLDLARGMMRHLRPGWSTLLTQCLDEAERALAARANEVHVS